MRRLLDRPVLVLTVALGLRFAFAGLLFATQLSPHNRWYFPNDDQLKYYGFARGLADGGLYPTIATIGYDLFLAPFAATTSFVLQAIPPVAIVQALLAIPATWLVYRAGERLAGRRAGTFAAALWALLPFFGLLNLPPSDGPATLWLGLKILTEYPSALLAILAVAIASGSRDDPGLARAAAAGLAAGYATLVKPPNAALVVGVVVALLVWRNARGALVAACAAAVVFLPQLVVNQRLFGGPLSFGYDPAVARRFPGFAPARVQAEGSWSPLAIPRVYGKLIVSNASGPLILIAAAAALVFAWRRAPAMRWLVVLPAVLYGVGLAMYHYAIGGFPRFITPALPLLALAAGAALFPGEAARSAPLRRRAAVPAVAVVVAGSLALTVWLAVAPKRPLAEVESLRPTATVSGRVVTLRWKPPSAPAKLTYTVLRSSSLAPPSGSVVRGFRWSYETPEFSVPAREGPSKIDRPPPGTWFYRVQITPKADSDGWPPSTPLGTSPPVRVVVR